jgi:hypothetical protein
MAEISLGVGNIASTVAMTGCIVRIIASTLTTFKIVIMINNTLLLGYFVLGTG